MKDTFLRSIQHIPQVGLIFVAFAVIIKVIIVSHLMGASITTAKASGMKDMTISIECRSRGAKGVVASLGGQELCDLAMERLASDYSSLRIVETGGNKRLAIEAEWQAANHIKGSIDISNNTEGNQTFSVETFTVDAVNPHSTARTFIRSLLKNLNN